MIPHGKVLAVAHDAGGAQIISSLLRLNNIPYLVCARGPALKIFQNKLHKFSNCSLEDGIKKSEWVLTGTSINDKLEFDAIKLAKKYNKLCISFLDNWVNYIERFSWHGDKILPNQIWVGDIYAFKKAKIYFEEAIIKLYPNPYWKEIESKKKYNTPKKKILPFSFIIASTNINMLRKKQSDIKFSDDDILIKVFENINKYYKKPMIKNITILLHPSEKVDKYSHLNFKEEKYDVIKINDPLNLLSKYSHIIGFESMLLVIGKLVNLKTINIDMGLPRLRVIPKKFIDIKWN